MRRRVKIQRLKCAAVIFLLLFMMTSPIADTPAMAAGGVASLHMNGGTGYNFQFVFALAGGGPNQSINIPGNGTVAAIYTPSGGSLQIGDQLIYVVVTDSSGAPIGVILPSAIGHRSDSTAVLQADGSMGANGQMVGNTGTINFWFNGFSSAGTQQGTSYIVANKVWLNADGTVFTGTPPALSFTLNGTTTVGSLPVINIPMLSGVPVLVLDGTYTIAEPAISGFNLISITSTTMTPNLPGRTATANNTSNSNYSATFTNQAIPNSTPFQMYGLKMGDGVPGLGYMPPGIFNFTVTDNATGLVVATGTNDVEQYYDSGTQTTQAYINFTPIVYTTADVGQQKTYTIREVGTTSQYWTFDNTSTITYWVNVSLNGNTIEGSAPYFVEILFRNSYNARGSFTPVASKTAAGGTMVANQFTYAVLDSAGNAVSTGTNDANGNILFTPITYSAPGTYTYTVVETNPNVNGWKLMNTAPFPLTVDVSDPNPPDGALVVTPTYPSGGITFINVYESSAFLSLSAQKTASNGTLSAGQFQFAVLDENGNVVVTGSNDANGTVVFGTIEYHSYNAADLGYHRYSIVETSTSGGGWTTSSVVYPLLVSVVDNGNGTMTATPFTILRSGTIFNNVYGASGSITLTANKTTNGGTLAAGQFSFAVQDEFGLVKAIGTNDAAGNITFTPINYTSADVGIHHYSVLETSQGGNGWTPSSVIYTVLVQVVDNGDGTITATPTYPASGVVFVNTYESGGSIALSGTKATVGGSIAANTFSFAVMDDSGTVVSTGTNDANGDILFSAIPYTITDVGTHNYTIAEKNVGAVSWTIDSTVYNVSVNVTDNGDGTLTAVANYPAGGLVFTNNFNAPAVGSLTIAKIFNGLPAGHNAFNQNNISPITFTVVGTGSAGAQIYRSVVPFTRANFTYNPITGGFQCILPNLPLGVYTVTESGGHVPGLELSLNVQLPSVPLVPTGATFSITNNYSTTPVTAPVDHPALTVNKVFHGLTTAQRPANFQIIITGPGGFSQTLNLDQAVSGTGGTFTNLAAGTYTITEANNNVPGYRMTVSINNNPVSLPYAVQVTGGHIMITIDDFYTPGASAPATGVRWNIIIPVILFVLAAACITVALILRKRSKNK